MLLIIQPFSPVERNNVVDHSPHPQFAHPPAPVSVDSKDVEFSSCSQNCLAPQRTTVSPFTISFLLKFLLCNFLIVLPQLIYSSVLSQFLFVGNIIQEIWSISQTPFMILWERSNHLAIFDSSNTYSACMFPSPECCFYFDGNYSGIQKLINNCKIYSMEEKSTTKKNWGEN